MPTDRSAIAEQVFATIADFFGHPRDSLSEATVAPDVPGWDSVSHVALLIELEGVLGLEFDIERIGTLQNVGDFITECERILAARG